MVAEDRVKTAAQHEGEEQIPSKKPSQKRKAPSRDSKAEHEDVVSERIVKQTRVTTRNKKKEKD